MKRFLVFSLLVIAILMGNSSLHAQKKRKSNPHEAGEDIHKHYTGTIGKRAVVFDITWGWQGGSNYGGSYFYYPNEPGTKHFYIGEPNTFDHDEILECTVVPENTKPGDNFFFDRTQPTETMEFTITGTHIRGKWHSADKKEIFFINAVEDYGDAVPLEMKFYNDNTIITNSKNKQFKVEYSFIGTTPFGTTQTTSTFINDAIIKFLYKGTTNKYTIDECLKAGVEQYYSELNKKKELFPDRSALSNSNRYAAFYGMLWLLPIYNDNDILVLKKSIDGMGLKGTQHGVCSYLCLDIASEKQLMLSDIITIDKSKLSVLMEKAFRNRYRVPASKKLGNVLKVSKMPFTANAAIVNGGLIFSYDYYALFRKRKDDFMKEEVNIFIPYTDLKNLLKPDFKQRIGM